MGKGVRVSLKNTLNLLVRLHVSHQSYHERSHISHHVSYRQLPQFAAGASASAFGTAARHTAENTDDA